MSSDLRHTLALLLISAAYADGRIHPREEKLIRLGLGTDVYQSALAAYEAADADRRGEMQEEVAAQLRDRQARKKNPPAELLLPDGLLRCSGVNVG